MPALTPAERAAILAIEAAQTAVDLAVLELEDARQRLNEVQMQEHRRAAGSDGVPLRLLTQDDL